jgi:hypothetical protein
MYQCISLHFKVFGCISWHCNWNFTNMFSLYHFAMQFYIHICFLLSTMNTILTCYTATILFPIFIDLFQLSILTFHIHTSPHVPNSMFHWLRGAKINSSSLYPKLLEWFKKSQCPKLGGWFFNWPNKLFFWKSIHTDGKRRYQLA